MERSLLKKMLFRLNGAPTFWSISGAGSTPLIFTMLIFVRRRGTKAQYAPKSSRLPFKLQGLKVGAPAFGAELAGITASGQAAGPKPNP